MSLVLGKNPSNELKEIELTNSGLLKVDVAGSSGTVSANVDITGNTIGLATESTLGTRASEATLTTVSTSLTTVVAQESTLAGQALNVANIDSKITQGYDAQVASGGSGLQQNLCYGLDTGGNLDALRVDNSGHLEITVDDFVKGQATMANSFPVVISSDQSAISVSSAGGNTTNNNESVAGLANGTANSTAVDMDGSSQLTIFGTSTNTSDPIIVQVSHNSSTWVEHTEYFVNFSSTGGAYAVNISNTGARYWRVSQTDTTTTAFTLIVNSSKK